MIGRFDYIEELLRTMDREQLKPTHDLLKSLFDGTALKKKKQPLLVDKTNIRMTKEEWNMEERKVPLEKYHDVIKAREKDQRIFREVLDKIEKVEPTFGNRYLKIEIDTTELDLLKRELGGR